MSYADPRWFNGDDPGPGSILAACIIMGMLLALLFGKAAGLIQ